MVGQKVMGRVHGIDSEAEMKWAISGFILNEDNKERDSYYHDNIDIGVMSRE